MKLFFSPTFPFAPVKDEPACGDGRYEGRGDRKLPPEKEPSPTLDSIVRPPKQGSSALFPHAPFSPASPLTLGRKTRFFLAKIRVLKSHQRHTG